QSTHESIHDPPQAEQYPRKSVFPARPATPPDQPFARPLPANAGARQHLENENGNSYLNTKSPARNRLENASSMQVHSPENQAASRASLRLVQSAVRYLRSPETQP